MASVFELAALDAIPGTVAAWTTPVTFVVGTMVDGTRLNVTWRDNLSAIDQHDHSGGSGSGTRAIGGATGETVWNLSYEGAPPRPTGTLTVMFIADSRLGWHSSAAAVPVLSTSSTHTHGY